MTFVAHSRYAQTAVHAFDSASLCTRTMPPPWMASVMYWHTAGRARRSSSFLVGDITMFSQLVSREEGGTLHAGESVSICVTPRVASIESAWSLSSGKSLDHSQ